jgi:hypothetical protein
MVDYLLMSKKVANLMALCPDCGSAIYKAISIAKIEQVQREMGITFPQAPRYVGEINKPTVNSDLKGQIQP